MKMTNYEAILRMEPQQMESFLDQVYLTGLNQGMYAESNRNEDILEDNPYHLQWLQGPAEEATAQITAEDGDLLLLSALTETILRSAGISRPE